MLRGIRTYVCKDCGHKFKALDMEWNATAASYPVKCPKCGSMHTYPSGYIIGGLFGLKKSFYRKIWKSMDERSNL